jgi:hypothetical protein
MKEPKYYFIIYIPEVTSFLILSDNKAKITAAFAMASGLNKLANLKFNISIVTKISKNHQAPTPVPNSEGRIIQI